VMIIPGLRSALRHIRSDCSQRECDRSRVARKVDPNAILGKAGYACRDRAGLGMMKPYLTIQRGAGIGLEKSAVAGNVTKRSRSRRLGNQHAHPPPPPRRCHSGSGAGFCCQGMNCRHAMPHIVPALHQASWAAAMKRYVLWLPNYMLSFAGIP